MGDEALLIDGLTQLYGAAQRAWRGRLLHSVTLDTRCLPLPACLVLAQNHWFGPAGDPRGAGIGTPEAIKLVWSCHREVIQDWGPVPPSSALKQS